MFPCCPPGTPLRVRVRLRLSQRTFHNRDSFAPRPCGKSRGWGKPAHPYNLIAAYDDRPQLSLHRLYVPLLQQFLHLFWRPGVPWPKPVSSPPIPHGERPWQRLCIQKVVRIISRFHPAGDAPNFDSRTSFVNLHLSRNPHGIFVIDGRLRIAQIGSDKHQFVGMLLDFPTQWQGEFFTRSRHLCRKSQNLLHVLELERNARLLSDSPHDSSLDRDRLTENPHSIDRCIHHYPLCALNLRLKTRIR